MRPSGPGSVRPNGRARQALRRQRRLLSVAAASVCPSPGVAGPRDLYEAAPQNRQIVSASDGCSTEVHRGHVGHQAAHPRG